MNTLELVVKHTKNTCFILAALTLLFFSNCKKEKSYAYEVNDVKLSQSSYSKNNIKTPIEFISIAYSDIFGSTINNDELNKLTIAYQAFGDKKLIEEMIIKDFLNDPDAKIPTKNSMNKNLEVFIDQAYQKFYNRKPNEFERWNVVNIIKADTSITPELIYYSMLTSNEYRYY